MNRLKKLPSRESAKRFVFRKILGIITLIGFGIIIYSCIVRNPKLFTLGFSLVVAAVLIGAAYVYFFGDLENSSRDDNDP